MEVMAEESEDLVEALGLVEIPAPVIRDKTVVTLQASEAAEAAEVDVLTLNMEATIINTIIQETVALDILVESLSMRLARSLFKLQMLRLRK